MQSDNREKGSGYVVGDIRRYVVDSNESMCSDLGPFRALLGSRSPGRPSNNLFAQNGNKPSAAFRFSLPELAESPIRYQNQPDISLRYAR